MSNELDKALADYDSSVDSIDFNLRMSLAEIVVTELSIGNRFKTQRALADACEKDEAFLSRILTGSTNWQCRTAAKILHVLGVRAEIRCVYPNANTIALSNGVFWNGQEEVVSEPVTIQQIDSSGEETRDYRSGVGDRRASTCMA